MVRKRPTGCWQNGDQMKREDNSTNDTKINTAAGHVLMITRVWNSEFSAILYYLRSIYFLTENILAAECNYTKLNQPKYC